MEELVCTAWTVSASCFHHEALGNTSSKTPTNIGPMERRREVFEGMLEARSVSLYFNYRDRTQQIS